MNKSYILLVWMALITGCKNKQAIFISHLVENHIPAGFTIPNMPTDNPMTEERILLGRYLFYSKKLSKDQTISCGSCHHIQNAMSDAPNIKSTGINSNQTKRNTTPLFNLAWHTAYMYDGAGKNLINQILIPLTSPLEMGLANTEYDTIVQRIQQDDLLLKLYENAFFTKEVSLVNIFKSIVQFELSLISANSKYDKMLRGESVFSPEETLGLQVFTRNTLGDSISGGCVRCHNLGSNFNNQFNLFFNNGLHVMPTDTGFAIISNNFNDVFKFKVPSLRNLVFTAPYFHDGSMNTLEQVIDFYSENVHANSPNVDPLIKPAFLNAKSKNALLSFLKTLSDSDFVHNTKFSNPY